MCTDNRFAKHGFGLPTIPLSTDETTWIPTDVHDYELYFDTNSEQLFQRIGSKIVNKSCCPKKATLYLNKTEVNNLHMSGHPLVVPPLNGSSAFGVRFASAPMLTVYDDGTPFSMPNFGFIEINNGASSFPNISAFPAQCVAEGVYTGSLLDTVRIPMASHAEATVTVSATHAITGGGVNSTMKIEVWYFLEN